MLTNKIMSEKLGIPITKVRRNTKEFLGEDPKALRRSGYKREFSINDGFFVYLGGYLVSELALSFESARKVIDTIKPYLYKIGLVPDIPDNAKRVGISREIIGGVEIKFWGFREKWGFGVSGLLKMRRIEKKDSVVQKYIIDKEERVTFWPEHSHRKMRDEMDFSDRDYELKTLPFWYLLSHFYGKVFDSGLLGFEEWYLKWRVLTAKPHKKRELKVLEIAIKAIENDRLRKSLIKIIDDEKLRNPSSNLKRTDLLQENL